MPDRSLQPAPLDHIPFDLPEIEIIDTPAGNRIYYCSQGKLPVVRYNVVTDCGSKDDPAGWEGLCNLMAVLLDENAAGMDSFRISDEFAMIGARFKIESATESVNFGLQSLSEMLEKGIELMSKIYFDPGFTESDFEREKQREIAGLMHMKTSPKSISGVVFDKLFYGSGSVYSRPEHGYLNTVEKISNNDIREFYNRNFRGRYRSFLVTGRADKQEIITLTDKYFGRQEAAGVTHSTDPENTEFRGKIYLTDFPGALQSEIYVAQLLPPPPSDELRAMMLVNYILGGQFSSRLNMNLREKNGYTYGVHSNVTSLKYHSVIITEGSFDTQKTSGALTEIISEYSRIAQDFSEKELNEAKDYFTKANRLRFETTGQSVLALNAIRRYGFPTDYYKKYADLINAVTYDQCLAVINKFLNPDNLFISVTGDKVNVIDELREKFPGREVVLTDAEGNLVQ
ncbi:MAG: insulinase family protein [Ignavibacteriaceae bacterium]|nr:insulinase family protein [Ignavibacteriaceae bacterium]